MNTKVLVLAMVGGLVLPVLPLLVGFIARLGEWPSHALPPTEALASTDSPAYEAAA